MPAGRLPENAKSCHARDFALCASMSEVSCFYPERGPNQVSARLGQPLT